MDWTVHTTVPFPLLEEPGVPEMLGEAGVGAEIYLAAAVLDDLSPDRAERAASRLAAAGVRTLTFHAPFEELWPGARDESARRLCEGRLLQAVSLAPLFRPLGIVAHGGYFSWLYDFDPERWLAPAARTFRAVAAKAEQAGVDLFLENVFDEVPDPLLALREAVGSPRIGFCLDPGHATLFSRLPVTKWIEAFAPALRELHVHDNRGLRDDHLPVGEGTINFRGVILGLLDQGVRPILTVEPHRKEHFPRAVGGLRRILSEIRAGGGPPDPTGTSPGPAAGRGGKRPAIPGKGSGA